ncbi:MAG: hypothetical protein JWN50_493 [Parcubacteria group bacterium]|nr:hypothetical protein [Parcubacteria group bacterium]
MRTHLLIVDPQDHFCDLPLPYQPLDPLTGRLQKPALPVPGSHDDMLRLAEYIGANSDDIDAITISLDGHNKIHIAHPIFWHNRNGEEPKPYDSITADEMIQGTWMTKDPHFHARAMRYLRKLNAAGKRHTIWPEHCLIGEWGSNIHHAVRRAVGRWSEKTLRPISYISKGANLFSEHFGAFAAEVPDPEDPSTMFNEAAFEAVIEADEVIVAGEASSHCVRETVEQIKDANPLMIERITMLADCMSPVPAVPDGPDFPALTRDWFGKMKDLGATITTSVEWRINKS